jgi:hypothetical protein
VGKAAADREFKGLFDCIAKCYKVRMFPSFIPLPDLLKVV